MLNNLIKIIKLRNIKMTEKLNRFKKKNSSLKISKIIS